MRALRASGVATADEQYGVSATEIANSGRQLVLRIDVDNKGSEPPVLLQAISYNVIGLGDTRT